MAISKYEKERQNKTISFTINSGMTLEELIEKVDGHTKDTWIEIIHEKYYNYCEMDVYLKYHRPETDEEYLARQNSLIERERKAEEYKKKNEEITAKRNKTKEENKKKKDLAELARLKALYEKDN